MFTLHSSLWEKEILNSRRVCSSLSASWRATLNTLEVIFILSTIYGLPSFLVRSYNLFRYSVGRDPRFRWPIKKGVALRAGSKQGPLFQKLPDEVKFLITIHLDVKSFNRLSQTNKQFQGISENRLLWRSFYERDFGALACILDNPKQSQAKIVELYKNMHLRLVYRPSQAVSDFNRNSISSLIQEEFQKSVLLFPHFVLTPFKVFGAVTFPIYVLLSAKLYARPMGHSSLTLMQLDMILSARGSLNVWKLHWFGIFNVLAVLVGMSDVFANTVGMLLVLYCQILTRLGKYVERALVPITSGLMLHLLFLPYTYLFLRQGGLINPQCPPIPTLLQVVLQILYLPVFAAILEPTVRCLEKESITRGVVKTFLVVAQCCYGVIAYLVRWFRRWILRGLATNDAFTDILAFCGNRQPFKVSIEMQPNEFL